MTQNPSFTTPIQAECIKLAIFIQIVTLKYKYKQISSGPSLNECISNRHALRQNKSD